MSTGFKVTGSELVEPGWLDNLLDAQTTTTIANGIRPIGTTSTAQQLTSVLPAVDSQHLHLHHYHQQQQQQPLCVKSEHSYSLGNDDGVDFNIKIEPEEQGERLRSNDAARIPVAGSSMIHA